MSVRFYTFAYNLRTVWSSNMKLLQRFEIIDLQVCSLPNFQAIGHVTLVLQPKNRPESLA